MSRARVLTMATMLGLAAPVAAQMAAAPASPAVPPPSAAFVVAPVPPTDPARLAAARPVIDHIWARGHYARMMHTMMDQFMPAAVARMMKMRPDDLLAGLGGKSPMLGTDGGTGKVPGETIGQMALEKDPYFQQRMTITLRVFGDEMAKVMTQVEPGVRDALAHSYARRFTVTQLGELDRFFATPTGAAYAADATTLMMSPDMAVAMQDFTPRLMKTLPDMIAKAAEATKDLPPPVTSARTNPPVIVVPPPKKKP